MEIIKKRKEKLYYFPEMDNILMDSSCFSLQNISIYGYNMSRYVAYIFK